MICPGCIIHKLIDSSLQGLENSSVGALNLLGIYLNITFKFLSGSRKIED
jgi:hypothetical protein